jgi:leucyl aminopeptidase (aminopeptidase T)
MQSMDLDPAVKAVVDTCLGVKPRENVVVVADEGTRGIGEALLAAARDAQAEAVLTIMAPRANHGEEPPDAVAAALHAAEVFIAPTTRSISHTRARKAASDNGARGATLPGVTEDLLARLMTADLDALKRRSQAVAKLLTDADEAQVTCPRGTDFRLDLASSAPTSPSSASAPTRRRRWAATSSRTRRCWALSTSRSARSAGRP